MCGDGSEFIASRGRCLALYDKYLEACMRDNERKPGSQVVMGLCEFGRVGGSVGELFRGPDGCVCSGFGSGSVGASVGFVLGETSEVDIAASRGGVCRSIESSEKACEVVGVDVGRVPEEPVEQVVGDVFEGGEGRQRVGGSGCVAGAGSGELCGETRQWRGTGAKVGGMFRRGPNFDKNQAKRDRRRERKRAVRQQGECGKPVWKSVRVEARKMHEAAKVLAHGDVTVQHHGPNHARNVANREAQKVVKKEEEQQRKMEWQRMKDVAAMARENRCSSCVMNDDRCDLCFVRHERDVAVTKFQAAKAAADLEQLRKAQSEGRYSWRENRVENYVDRQRVTTVLSSDTRQSTPDSVPSLRSGSLTPGSSASVPRTVAAVADVLDDLILTSGDNVAEVVKKMEKDKLMKIMPKFVRDAVVEKYGISGFFDDSDSYGFDAYCTEEIYD